MELTERIRAVESRINALESRIQASEIFTEEMRVGLMQSIEHVQHSVDQIHEDLREHTKLEEQGRRALVRTLFTVLGALILSLGGWLLYNVARLV